MIKAYPIKKEVVLETIDLIYTYTHKPWDLEVEYDFKRRFIQTDILPGDIFALPSNLSFVVDKKEEFYRYLQIYKALIIQLRYHGCEPDRIADTIVVAGQKDVVKEDYVETLKWWNIIKQVPRKKGEDRIPIFLELLDFFICFCRCYGIRVDNKLEHNYVYHVHPLLTNGTKIYNIFDYIMKLPVEVIDSARMQTFETNRVNLRAVMTELDIKKDVLAGEGEKIEEAKNLFRTVFADCFTCFRYKLIETNKLDDDFNIINKDSRTNARRALKLFRSCSIDPYIRSIPHKEQLAQTPLDRMSEERLLEDILKEWITSSCMLEEERIRIHYNRILRILALAESYGFDLLQWTINAHYNLDQEWSM